MKFYEIVILLSFFSLVLIILQKINSKLIQNSIIIYILTIFSYIILFYVFYTSEVYNFIVGLFFITQFFLLKIIILQSLRSSIQFNIIKDIYLKKKMFNDEILFKKRILNLIKNQIIIKKKSIYIIEKNKIKFVVWFFIFLRKIYGIQK